MQATDIIILSNARNGRLIDYTQQAVDSCLRSESDFQFNVIVLEQNTDISYRRCQTVNITEPFNYNRFMNKGISMGNAEYVCLCNNDIIFQRHWCSHIVAAMEEEYLLSASPFCPRTQGAVASTGPAVDYGYDIRHHISGWCIMVNRFLLDIIGPLDEEFPFWYADNVYAAQLKRNKVKHALVRSSVVLHLGSKTLKTYAHPEQDQMTIEYNAQFYKKYPEDSTE